MSADSRSDLPTPATADFHEVIMALPIPLQRLRIPVIAAPMFIVSVPALVIAQCKSGIVGSMPALSARPSEQLDDWLAEITETLASHDAANPSRPAAPFAINQIVHKTNQRWERDLRICEKHKVPVIISSLGAREELNAAVHAWGGMTFHDVINNRFARKAIEKGADGLIAVAAGAGGHAGSTSPFALVEEIRRWFKGPLALSGAIATGRGILAARAMGADFAYVGSAFIATEEANALPHYKQTILDCSSEDIVYSNYFTGVFGNYLKPTIRAAGLDPENLPSREERGMEFARDGGGAKIKAWRDIRGAGHGIGAIDQVVPVAALIDRLEREYLAARLALKT